LFFRNKIKKITVPTQVKSCLIIHDNSKLGDLIVLSSIYREFYKKGVKITILTNKASGKFLSSNKNIFELCVKESTSIYKVLPLCRYLRNLKFDIVLDPFETMPSFKHSLILSNLNNSYILGFDRWYKRYYSFYHPHDELLKEHISSRAVEILKHIYGDVPFNTNYDLHLPVEVENKIKSFVGNTRVVIINPLGAKKICRLTPEQIKIIYQEVKFRFRYYRVIFTGLPQDLLSLQIPEIETLPFDDFIYTVALTKYSDFVISVDTALVHIAAGYNKPTLAFYPNSRRPEYPSHLIWAPNNQLSIQIISPTFTVKDINAETLVRSVSRLIYKYKK
ncbi:lipopolysaccharide heptosyltransferase family protein, partial [Escherichia albertii]|nr:lipopolysaccharide heptosyltransferase family protein [Escherichia albertii]